ncbi:MAG: hypothetical protein RRX93_04050 [Bacteroidales bacterium]
MNTKLKIALQIVLAAVAVILAFAIYKSIMQPVRFNKEKNQRAQIVVQRLKDIRTVEEAFKKANNRFIGDIDSLVDFLQNGELPYTKMIGNVPDSLTEEEAVKKGIVSREIFKEKAYEVLFPNHPDKEKHLANLAYVPFTEKTKKIHLEAGFVSKSGFQVPVFEATVPFEEFLIGMNDQDIQNLNSKSNDMNRYPGIKVGSMNEAITEGNWE